LEQLGLEPGAVVSERELEALFARGLHPSAGSRWAGRGAPMG